MTRPARQPPVRVPSEGVVLHYGEIGTKGANRVQFRIRDMAGVTGTSAVYAVTTSATIAGLPRNGSVELGT